METTEAYQELVRRSREQGVLESCAALLGWDEQTYLPSSGTPFRGEQLAMLAGLEHERATDPRIGELLDFLEDSDIVSDPESAEAINVRESRRDYDRKTKLPRRLVEELAQVTSTAQHEWIAARAESSFPRFQPWLDRVLELKREEASCLLKEGVRPYDTLLDQYEPGATERELESLFGDLRRELTPIVEAIVGSGRKPAPTTLEGPFSEERQRILGELVADAVGFDFERGRLDVSAHPFCTGIGPGDCRITTRYRADDFSESFFGVLHEVGHGLYEQGLDPIHFGTPMGEAVSLGIHESQSRLWENLVGRSQPFWQHWFPITRSLFGGAIGTKQLDPFLFAVNQVKPSLIRTQADEATYNLHILIRFDLERALLSGDLLTEDLPEAWNEAYRRDLGIEVPGIAEGCLQDIHWSAGLIGYFPTYTLGNLYASILYKEAAAVIGDLDLELCKGNTRALLDWLRTHVHRHGRRYRPAELVQQATGTEISHLPFIESLRERYGRFYDL